MSESACFSSEQIGDVHVLRLTCGDLADRPTVQAVEQALHDYSARVKPATVVLDFNAVRFLTSEMLSALLRVRETTEAQGGAVRLRGLSTTLLDVFRITRLDRVFPIEP